MLSAGRPEAGQSSAPVTSEAAGVFRGTMGLHEQSATPNPYVLAGYGPSVWDGNVAIMQSTESQLERVAQLRVDQDNGIYDEPVAVHDARAPNINVDLDFQQALINSAVNV